jgi:toxin CcdB
VNPNPETRAEHPYLVVLQSDMVSAIETRVVAPLVSPRQVRFLERLLPEVTVQGHKYVIAVPDLAAVPAQALGETVANLEDYRYQIVGAIDLLFTGI